MRSNALVHTRHVQNTRHGMVTADAHIADWLRGDPHRVSGDPGLSLTEPQMRQRWGRGEVTSEALLSALVDVKVLRRTHQDASVRADLG